MPFYTDRRKAITKSRAKNPSRLISAFLDIRSPLYIRGEKSFSDIRDVAEMIDTAAPAGPNLRDGIAETLYEYGIHAACSALSAGLRIRGYDGLCLRVAGDAPARSAWFPATSSQILLHSDMNAAKAKDVWDLTVEQFTGPSLISPKFKFDGRGGEYDHLWDVMNTEGGVLPVLARDHQGWESRWLDNWEPPGTMGLFDPTGEARGFYMAGLIWVDPIARGESRTRLMILASAARG